MLKSAQLANAKINLIWQWCQVSLLCTLRFCFVDRIQESISVFRVGCGVFFGLWFSAVSAAEPIRIVALGDSLTAGSGLSVEDGFTTQLQAALTQRSYDVEIFNAGVLGDTTSGALARLDWVLADGVSAVIVNIGNNDALRGIRVDIIRRDLDAILTKLRTRNLPTLLAGAKAPRNLGPDYYLEFDAIYPQLAEKHEILFYPFYLDGVATNPDFNQADGIHPNREGVSWIVKRMLPFVEQLLDQVPQ